MKEFAYSQGVAIDTFNLIKKLIFILDTIFQFAYIGYLVFRLLSGGGIFIAYVILVGLSAGYLIYSLITRREFYTMKQKKGRKRVKTTITIFKRITNLVVITFAVVQLCLSTASDNIGVLLTLLMVCCYLFSILFDILNAFIDTKIDMITSAVRVDMYELKELHPHLTGIAQKLGLRLFDKQPYVDADTLAKIKEARHRCDAQKRRKEDFLNDIQ